MRQARQAGAAEGLYVGDGEVAGGPIPAVHSQDPVPSPDRPAPAPSPDPSPSPQPPPGQPDPGPSAHFDPPRRLASQPRTSRAA